MMKFFIATSEDGTEYGIRLLDVSGFRFWPERVVDGKKEKPSVEIYMRSGSRSTIYGKEAVNFVETIKNIE